MRMKFSVELDEDEISNILCKHVAEELKCNPTDLTVKFDIDKTCIESGDQRDPPVYKYYLSSAKITKLGKK